MNLAVTIMDSPTASGAAWCALAFCRAALAQSLPVQVLFHGEASYICGSPDQLDDGQPSLRRQWQSLAEQHPHLKVYVCPAASDRRLKPAEAPPFERLGLIAWLQKVAESDRAVQFGSGR